mmetsp:Transcript_106530/g.308296  ORF Transcript_106530/g.308296 Transcript_106530/m.308296 type:complete len:204 (-) Transcript_106530:508-1119(-)
MSSFCAFFACASFSRACCRTTSCASSSCASCAFSTTTARIKLMTNKSIVTKTNKKKKIVNGASSTMGMVTCPQLSPATICCKKVRFASHTDSKACGHREHPSYLISLLMGCINCTAIKEKKVMNPARSMIPQNTVLIVPAKPLIIVANSGNNTRTRIARASRTSRKLRRTERFGNLPMTPRKTCKIKSMPTTTTSSKFHELRK